MKKKFFLTLFSLVHFVINAQCLSGNCQDGFGKIDFGYATYEGNFKSGKPNGQGTMDYGGGDKFVGNFTNGQENGDGKLYKKNIPLDVTYIDGKVNYRPKQVVVGGNVPKVDGCKKGDCHNGFGIVQFDSGNRYEGNFEYGIKSGEGKFFYASGNIFTGNFKDNIYTTGVFNYANEGVTFDGNYNADGSPKTGKYYYAINKATVLVENGKITKIDNPVARRADSLAIENSKPRKCYNCNGGGMIAGVDRRVESEYYYSIDYRRSDGSLFASRSGNVGKTTKTERGWPTECKVCRGTGQEMPVGAIIMNGGRY